MLGRTCCLRELRWVIAFIVPVCEIFRPVDHWRRLIIFYFFFFFKRYLHTTRLMDKSRWSWKRHVMTLNTENPDERFFVKKKSVVGRPRAFTMVKLGGEKRKRSLDQNFDLIIDSFLITGHLINQWVTMSPRSTTSLPCWRFSKPPSYKMSHFTFCFPWESIVIRGTQKHAESSHNKSSGFWQRLPINSLKISVRLFVFRSYRISIFNTSWMLVRQCSSTSMTSEYRQHQVKLFLVDLWTKNWAWCNVSKGGEGVHVRFKPVSNS